MTLKNNIRESLLYFPTIYDNALDVLHHLYCVNGNGYEWVNGELVECSGRERSISVKDAIEHNIARRLNSENINSTIESAMLLLDIDEKNPDYMKLSKALSDRLSKDVTRVVNMTLDIEHRASDFSIATLKDYPDSFTCMVRERNLDSVRKKMFAWHLYPLCEYSKLCTIPDDIKEDYLAGAEKMIEFIKANPEIHKESDYESNMEWLKKAEERIAEIRKMCEEQKEEE
jgi:hypothetical protein